MRTLLPDRGLRFVFAANLISMVGSGMNTAATTWFILQATGSEIALGTLVVLQTIPAIVLMPLTGVVIDRTDRRHLVMWLDASRAIVILLVATLALQSRVEVWHLYAMNTLVATGFWMFWPTVTALVQELSPAAQFTSANALLLAGVQGGFLLAGAVVGFIYNRLGLGGILLIDVATYAASFLCYTAAREGWQPPPRPAAEGPDEPGTPARPTGAVARYVRELQEGLLFVGRNRYLTMLGASWALFIGAMLTQAVITAPLSDRVLHAGAVGYGWLNGGWGVGACFSSLVAPALIPVLGARRAAAVSLSLLSASVFALPFSRLLAVAVALFVVMGSARGIGGVAISTNMMEIVPKHFMGRVQNTFYLAGCALQVALALAVGAIAERVALAAAFAVVGLVYLVACITSVWPVSLAGAPGPGVAAETVE